MNTTPAISVLMPVYNGEEFLEECIESILSQTLSNFEFIIVDDASTDRTASILQNVKQTDARVKIITHPINKGRAVARNTALQNATAPYIAIMDADDWAYPQRLERQYNFMLQNPDVVVCGAYMEIYETRLPMPLPPIRNDDIKVYLLFDSYIANPTAMCKRDALLSLTLSYNRLYKWAQDYELWANIMLHPYAKFANYPEILLRYRIHPTIKRTNYKTKQKEYADKVRLYLLARMGITPTEKEFNCHLAWDGLRHIDSFSDLIYCFHWKNKLINQSLSCSFVNTKALQRFYTKKTFKLIARFLRSAVCRIMGK